MKINAIMVALLHIPAEHKETYNRWYDLDHLPEHISKGDVLMGRRYAATVPVRSAPGVVASELTDGHPSYATIYWFGGPLDFESEEARSGWLVKDKFITKAGRYWRAGVVPYSAGWRLARARARRSIRIDEEAITYLPHRGMILILGKARSAAERADALAWWRDSQEDDLLDLPGVLAVLEFSPGEGVGDDQILHIVLCEDSPVEVMAALEQSRTLQQLTGRFPAHKGVYEQLALLPYQSIVPLDYSFDME
ncbi:MAG: hypothetical protein AB7V43_22580 [Acidimicrobiia bacterium]